MFSQCCGFTSPLAVNFAEGGEVGDVVLAGRLEVTGGSRLIVPPLVELITLAHSDKCHRHYHENYISENDISDGDEIYFFMSAFIFCLLAIALDNNGLP